MSRNSFKAQSPSCFYCMDREHFFFQFGELLATLLLLLNWSIYMSMAQEAMREVTKGRLASVYCFVVEALDFSRKKGS